MLTRHALRAAAVFALVGAISRFTLRTTETRWQIAVFWGVAAGWQLVVRPAMGRRSSGADLALDGVCATVTIIAMKVAIEGKL